MERKESFAYDAIGNLIQHNKSSGNTALTWNAYGKVRQVTTTNATMTFGYDAQQNRLRKTVTANGETKTSYYIRDAQGNALAVYEQKGASLVWKEQDLYGSSRLGVAKPEREVTGFFWAGAAYTLVAGAKSYELSNHLGNVLATISDRGELQSAQDYYPFGMAMPGRSSGAYRYGFNGKETDPETGIQDYGMRWYLPNIARFPSVDPLTKKYPWYTPYQFAGNKPVIAIDLDGLEEAVTTFSYRKANKNEIQQRGTAGNNTGISANSVVRTSLDLETDRSKPRNEIIKINMEGQLYTANSLETLNGRNGRVSIEGNFSGVTVITKVQLLEVLAYSRFVVQTVHHGNVESAILAESNAGPRKNKRSLLDFKNIFYRMMGIERTELLAINGIAYNANEAGNYLWGMALSYLGSYLNADYIAEKGTSGRHDEPEEQQAIKSGMADLDKWKLSEEDKETIEHIQKEYERDFIEYKEAKKDLTTWQPSCNLCSGK